MPDDQVSESSASGSGDAPAVPSPEEQVPSPTEEKSLIKKESSSRLVTTEEDVSDDEEEDFEDETLYERFLGLSEMFPSGLRSGVAKLSHWSWSSTKSLYAFARSATFIGFTTALIFFMPVAFELERAQLEDMQKKQMLLGPAAGLGPLGPGGPLPRGIVGGPPPPPK